MGKTYVKVLYNYCRTLFSTYVFVLKDDAIFLKKSSKKISVGYDHVKKEHNQLSGGNHEKGKIFSK